ncbi:ribonuclease III [Sinimarinibacterium sp. NLF-5-8]|uniref:ribonuclease III n=1 Tax=Sinimarinibacterium sp. NLF-5-8 TaxID=2698684 RepID=UPI00137B9F67|nr:ribonuclease III [Sinimarinibacterium sp. NLF-5-8]QHS09827.1 ribonuclease III [Sinimarinibacterium sp. NLF-5-8]
MADLTRLQKQLGYRFGDPALLQLALTHRSASGRNNERLEFLGDALINFVAAAALYECRPKAEEGALSRLRASLVREESLAFLARELKLSDVLTLGESELKSGGFRRDSILADAFEAVMGAILLDGGFAAASAAARQQFAAMLSNLPDAETLKDPKTRLQEWLQARARPLPHYTVLSEQGPAHARRFHVRCELADEPASTEAIASSRRGAEQQAAADLLHQLENPVHA